MNPGFPELMTRTFSEDETFHLGERLAGKLNGNELILISGELGAGKTIFVKGLASGLGVTEVDSVCSPSFTLVNIYKGRVKFFHVDLYRLERPEEIADLGLEDYLGEGLVAVEWAEKLPAEFETEKVIKVSIEVDTDESRIIRITSKGYLPWIIQK
jgi:tRNA threonylcarbamoyladenosine biosynthesis protein TsaE